MSDVDNIDDLKKRIIELETKLNANISQADSLADELMKLRYAFGSLQELFKNMVFVILYHHQSIKVEFMYHGQFSDDLKIVYVPDNLMFINKILGLHIVGYWFEHDTNLECQKIIKQRMLITRNTFFTSKEERNALP